MKKKTLLGAVLLVLAATVAFAGGAQEPEPIITLAQGEGLGLTPNTQFVISAEDLIAESASNPKLVIIDARRAGDYNGGFIPGAVNIFPRDTIDTTVKLENGNDVAALIKSPAEITPILRGAGISADSKVVIYSSGVNSEAARIFWALDYYGLEDKALLDGGIEAWKEAGGEISRTRPTPTPGTFTPAPDDSKIATYEYVKSIQGTESTLLCDALSENNFASGAIPGSVNLPYSNTFSDGAYLRSAAELEALLVSAGFQADQEIVFYCGAGYTAAQNYFIARYLGIEKVRNYDGSRRDWSARGDVLTPSGRAES